MRYKCKEWGVFGCMDIFPSTTIASHFTLLPRIWNIPIWTFTFWIWTVLWLFYFTITSINSRKPPIMTGSTLQLLDRYLSQLASCIMLVHCKLLWISTQYILYFIVLIYQCKYGFTKCPISLPISSSCWFIYMELCMSFLPQVCILIIW